MACHMGSPSLDPHPYIPLMLRAKMAGQWQRLAVDLKVAITNVHPRREEVPALPNPNVYFFLVGVYNRSPEFSLLQSCGTFHDFHLLLEMSVL